MCSDQQLETDNCQELESLRFHYDKNNSNSRYKYSRLSIVNSEES